MNTSADKDTPPKKPGFFSRLRQRLNRGKGLGLSSLNWLTGRGLDEELEEEIEERLLLADVGVETTERILNGLRKSAGSLKNDDSEGLKKALQAELLAILKPRAIPLTIPADKRPYVILMVGVNGSGKTTTIGKLAHHLKDQGLSVLLAAGDTYRAAATEQLQAWGDRNQVPVISQKPGADPAAVIYDALEMARAKNIDVVLADTAGRLQNQEGLMRELEKVVRIAGKQDPEAPHEKMLVLDSSLGQNALNQAIHFNTAIGLTGITMTKLDGGGQGGILLAIANQLDVPFRFIGIGEQREDMAPFDAEKFTDALLGFRDEQDTATR
ncbi:MAG: signal recognition particle-docking protein FtsY [Gammaproteobacteria bacterium]|nr:signal recognition particle-docking protein FtsY [Gammaproteobacteria bacterium]MCP4091708.1 signal recognition particle-docking protein FtsY [Gammaproteobacteria bacterium]MCP4275015.1 signal recognition particle-docking protein FtsY [Gammaproteobacteria bacterium]MCP4831838.1 signal recognition particle-docking protein FtsY [Gammaproteobacteria bacterium]MCP4929774.1 signal recognition particle-docking protein FtsY [Gammaproteobacteria bacterium]